MEAVVTGKLTKGTMAEVKSMVKEAMTPHSFVTFGYPDDTIIISGKVRCIDRLQELQRLVNAKVRFKGNALDFRIRLEIKGTQTGRTMINKNDIEHALQLIGPPSSLHFDSKSLKTYITVRDRSVFNGTYKKVTLTYTNGNKYTFKGIVDAKVRTDKSGSKTLLIRYTENVKDKNLPEGVVVSTQGKVRRVVEIPTKLVHNIQTVNPDGSVTFYGKNLL
jgi:hypothetical protein